MGVDSGDMGLVEGVILGVIELLGLNKCHGALVRAYESDGCTHTAMEAHGTHLHRGKDGGIFINVDCYMRMAV